MIDSDYFLNELKITFLIDEVIVKYYNIFLDGKRKKRSRIYLVIKTNKRNIFVKYQPKAKKNIFKKEYKTLVLINLKKISAPRQIELIDKGLVMSVIAGKKLDEMIDKEGLVFNSKLLFECVNFISAFHEDNLRLINSEDKIAIYEKNLGKKISLDNKKIISNAKFGFIHGDLDPFNTFYDHKKSKFILIDWEDFNDCGIQELDMLHFIVMLGIIANPDSSRKDLYNIIFKKSKNNFYLSLLARYCDNRSISMSHMLQLIPVYCDFQNLRLIKAKRDTSIFLYNEFKSLYYEA
jgi:hypothetical protein